MYAQVEKPKENRSRPFVNSVAQKKSVSRQGFGFVDNRTEAIHLRQLQSIAVNHAEQRESIQRIANYSTNEESLVRKSDHGTTTKDIVQRNKKGAVAGAAIGAGIGALGFFAKPIVGGITTALGAGIGGLVGHFATKKDVVTIARNAATAFGTEDPTWVELSGLMCWDAVGRCGYKAGLTSLQDGGGANIINNTDALVLNSAVIPAAHIIGFFNPASQLVHAMLSLDASQAAGNKNNCVLAAGNAAGVGWEQLALPAVNAMTGIFVDAQGRNIVMRHKSF